MNTQILKVDFFLSYLYTMSIFKNTCTFPSEEYLHYVIEKSCDKQDRPIFPDLLTKRLKNKTLDVQQFVELVYQTKEDTFMGIDSDDCKIVSKEDVYTDVCVTSKSLYMMAKYSKCSDSFIKHSLKSRKKIYEYRKSLWT